MCRCGELHTVSDREGSLFFTVDRHSLLAARIVGALRAIGPFNGQPIARSIDGRHSCVFAFTDPRLFRGAAITQDITDLIALPPTYGPRRLGPGAAQALAPDTLLC